MDKSQRFITTETAKRRPLPLRLLPVILVNAGLVLILAVACGGASTTPTPTTKAPAPPSPTVYREAVVVPTPSPTPTAKPVTLKVGNTGGSGVYIRRSPSAADRIKAWPDGTPMVVVGADQQGEGRTWKNVRDPDGNVGWVPAEYLVGS